MSPGKWQKTFTSDNYVALFYKSKMILNYYLDYLGNINLEIHGDNRDPETPDTCRSLSNKKFGRKRNWYNASSIMVTCIKHDIFSHLTVVDWSKKRIDHLPPLPSYPPPHYIHYLVLLRLSVPLQTIIIRLDNQPWWIMLLTLYLSIFVL